ncbi:MAG: MATE family efflux transporter [Devosiaceae bacterium]|nr:MATE family efflux transporter [Devosiaceae bacterium MH13]
MATKSADADDATPRFVTGSTMRHTVVMTGTASVGLVAIFIVDFANLFYIAQLGETELAAAIGYAGTLMFFVTSAAIGSTIGITALVSRALGAGDLERARSIGGTGLIMIAALISLVSLVCFVFLEPLLAGLGATGRTLEVAVGFLQIVLPSMPLLALGMAMSGLLRAVGDARRAMYVTLGAGVAAAIMDPIFIFGLDMGVNGAAISTNISRLALLGLGVHGALVVHKLGKWPDMSVFAEHGRALAAIAVPAILTNVATPVGNAIVTRAIAPFGDDAVAGWAIVGRIIPVAFGAIFALSGAVGPILGQNFGAGKIDRVRRAFMDALVLILGYTAVVWAILFVAREPIVALFDATGDAASLVILFCTYVAASFVFNGALFVANASFNNLGFATYSTVFNWGKATIGTLPFVWLGAQWGGAAGVLIGQAIGSVVFGLAAVITAYITMQRLEPPKSDDHHIAPHRPEPAPFASGKAAS